ncbi:hypothetical protein ACFYO5_28710 [Streptomyces sp. NPDC006259]|uniref:hypothetical protein n=1 Tax=Streptomyces sp. NPDC006259 TaxID=3364740 RepID=UPI0036BAB58C
MNPVIMRGLSMAVIAGMLDAGGLGGAVNEAVGRLDIGLGFEDAVRARPQGDPGLLDTWAPSTTPVDSPCRQPPSTAPGAEPGGRVT